MGREERWDRETANKLGAVSLESGHVYAKALYTIKSCVGPP